MAKNCRLPTAIVFDEVAPFWSEIADADATGQQIELVKNTVDPAGKVLDLACGNGRHAVALCKAGYRMVGLDISKQLLQIAKARAHQGQVDLPLVCGDVQHLPFQANSFSAVLSLDQSMGYLVDENADIAVLKGAASTLQPQGTILVDVFNGPYMIKRYSKNRSITAKWALWTLQRLPFLAGLFRWHSYPSFWLMYQRSANAKNGMLCDIWVFRGKATGKVSITKHATRLYGYVQLRRIIENAGLRVWQVYGSYGKEAYNVDAKRLIIFSQKIQQL